jgi:hypothetical protein
MTRRAAVGVVALALLGGLVWSLVPPFPSAGTVIVSSLPALVKTLGTPTKSAVDGSADFVWERTRGIGVWTLRAHWSKDPAGLLEHPSVVWVCFRIKGTPERSSFCRANAWVMASNNRWRGP